MSLVLKLSKCRLCLKLGDFYSIFAVDNSIQLSKMAMACSEIKIYEGDGLPDKICGECIEKLSSAYIFKQQCERSDTELRKSLLNTSGGAEISSYGRRNSDSGFSNFTDVSTSKKEKNQKSKRQKNGPSPERAYANAGGLLEESYSVDVQDPLSYEGVSSQPAPYNKHLTKSSDSGSNSPVINESARFECRKCNKTFLNAKSLKIHSSQHQNSEDETFEFEEEEPESILPERNSNHGESSQDVKCKDLFDCHLCGKQFKFNIMLNRHLLTCNGPAETIKTEKMFSPSVLNPKNNLKCPVCGKLFKKHLYVTRHLYRSVCGEIAKEFPDEPHSTQSKEDLPLSEAAKSAFAAECSICTARFSSHTSMFKHLQLCIRRRGGGTIKCITCNITYSQKNGLYRHIKKTHYPMEQVKKKSGSSAVELLQPKLEPVSADDGGGSGGALKCRECDKTFSDQMQLVMHLAAHMANINEPKGIPKTKISFDGTEYECQDCSKKFKYKGNLRVHLKSHHNYTIDIIHSLEASLSEFKCDMCDKAFQFEKSLTYHKNSKHNKYSKATPQKMDPAAIPVIMNFTEPIVFTKCPAKCIHCNVMLKNLAETKKHNRMHIDLNVKPKNEYNCPMCGVQFTNTKFFSVHIAEHNAQIAQTNSSLQGAQSDGNDSDEINAMDFCESVVANIKQEKGEGEGHDGLEDPAPGGPQELVVSLGGFTCQQCNKTLASLKSYKYHMSWHSSRARAATKEVVCPICSAVFRYDSHLREHMRQHALACVADPTLLNCKLCPRTTKNLRGYIAHMNWHNARADFRCPVCLKQFTKRGHLTMHYRLHVKRNETKMIDCYTDERTERLDKVTNFQCKICHKYMPTEVSLTYHERWHSSPAARSATRYECTKCNIAFTNKNRYILHSRMHGDGSTGPYKCHICNKGLKSAGHLAAHIKSHSFVNRLKRNPLAVVCPVCDQVFAHQVKLQRHIRRSHPEEKMVKKIDPGADDIPVIRHICKICGKEFHTEHKLKMHSRRHDLKHSFYICSLCSKRNISLKMHNLHIKGHLLQVFKENPIKCEHCEECFIRRKDLHIHMFKVHDILENYISKVDNRKNVTELKEYQCHVCFKVLANESSYQRHIDYHNSMRCNYCFKYFSNKTFVQAHVLYDCDRKKVLGASDPYEKKLKCRVCYKAFSLAVKLHCHMKVQHNLEPAPSCQEQNHMTVCDFCFSTQPNEKQMLKHRAIHLRFQTYYGCHFCARKFVTMRHFVKHKRNHLNKHYTENPLQCEDCPENFVYFNDYSTHLQEIHGKEVNWVILPKESPEEDCPICKKRFSHLHNHLMYHEKYKCKKCNEYFLSDSLFESHLCPVADEADDEEVVEKPSANIFFNKQPNRVLLPYEECDFCFKPYSNNYTKAMHIRVHKKVTNFGCRYCEKTFTSLALFSIHTPTHRMRHYKKNPLLCKHCGETFIKYGLYIRHLRDIHNDKESMMIYPFYPAEECKICKKTFECIHHHYRFHLQFRCQSCLKYIVSEKLFNSHICGNMDEDQSLIFECDEDIAPLSIGTFNYDTLRNRSLEHNDLADTSLEQSKDFSLDEIDLTETELDSSALNSVDLTNMSYSPDITESNRDMIVQIPDQVLFSNYNSNTSFENFTPVISSTVSLSSSSTPAIANERKDQEKKDMDLDKDDGVESAEELHKIVDDLENSYTLPSESLKAIKEEVH